LAGYPTEINVDFVLMGIHTQDIEGMSAALAKIEKYLGREVDLVLAVKDKPRCFYCGCLNDKDANQCSQCGAAL
jgi:hypothetical protein